MDEATQKRHLEVLRDRKNDLVKRIQSAVKLNLEYWSDRNNPPNLSEQAFRIIVNNIPSNYSLKFSVRKSFAGRHGTSGEMEVFSIEFKLPIRREIVCYYLKGYFFDEGDLNGVCIQSFRVTRKLSRSRISIV